MMDTDGNRLRQRMRAVKKMFESSAFLKAELAVLFLICFIYALSAGRYVNFYPFNGTFQNFNPVRRFLDGQIPYRDFSDYLGLGHLYVGTVTTLLFGGNYRGSLIAFMFLTLVGGGVIVPHDWQGCL